MAAREFRDTGGLPVLFSIQDIVGIYNDVNATPLYAFGPVGIQVEQRSMAFITGRTRQVINGHRCMDYKLRHLA